VCAPCFANARGGVTCQRETCATTMWPTGQPYRAPPPGGSLAKILVADDHDDARRVFCSVLRDAHHEVIEAADGLQAIALSEQHRPDVALIDVFMPGRDGVEVIRSLRAADPRIRVLAVSAGWHLKLPTRGGASQGDLMQDARAAGADGTISKPVDHRFLLAEVERLLRERPLDG
jgi:CheY-like chemotaxis protein